MTIPFNLRKFDSISQSELTSKVTQETNSSDLAISNTDMQAQRNATADQPVDRGICFGFTAR